MRSLHGGVSVGDVLNLITSGAAQTRNELVEATGLSRSTVVERLDVLFEAHLVVESPDVRPSGGRPSRRLVLNHGHAFVIAADVGEDHVRTGLYNLGGRLVEQEVAEVAVTSGPVAVLTLILDSAERLLLGNGQRVTDLIGVALALPAPVHFRLGRVAEPSVLVGWGESDLIGIVRQRFDVPVLVENDVNAQAFGEFNSHWSDVDQVLYVKVGTGIGSAIISNGELFRGAQGAAGDIGHMRIVPNGPLCRCGSRGCVEALAAGWAIVRDVQELGVSEVRSAREVMMARDPRVTHQVREAGRVLGQALGLCLSMLNPKTVIIGGTLSGDDLLAGMRETIYQHALPLATRELVLSQAKSDGGTTMRGAAELVIAHALAPSVITDHIARRSVRPS